MDTEGKRRPGPQAPPVGARVAALLAACDPLSVEPERFWGAQFDQGLAWVDFPVGLGGSGWDSAVQQAVDLELRAAGAPDNWARNPIGLGVAAPAIVSAGSGAQARRHLRPLFTCEEVWCQLYSEPGAGSDLAGIGTRAARDRGGWVIDGHKTWVSLAHVARWGLLLARTDPGLPKHRGITCFVVDLTAPGVEVRPLRQMTGAAEFDEVDLTGVRVPDDHRLGDVGQGWEVAMATLAHERLAIGRRSASRLASAMDDALRQWNQRADKDPGLRDELVRLWVESEVVRLTSLRAADMTGGSAIAKLASSELNQRVRALSVTLAGAEGMLYDSYEMTRPASLGTGPERPVGAGDTGPERPVGAGDTGPERPVGAGDTGPERPVGAGDTGPERPVGAGDTAGHDVGRLFLRSRANSVEGGTSEILRTILGERVLGLPPEPRVDRNRPWSEVRRA